MATGSRDSIVAINTLISRRVSRETSLPVLPYRPSFDVLESTVNAITASSSEVPSDPDPTTICELQRADPKLHPMVLYLVDGANQ